MTNLFGEDAFDTVVDTFSLCVMGNEGARRCPQEMTGVVKARGTTCNCFTMKQALLLTCHQSNPHALYNALLFTGVGQILLIENTRASNSILGYYQDITASTACNNNLQQ